ncbi:hypothetical protein KEM60_02863 [Austwickia sp. TVS 96-490-7B]|uniref:LppA family lipoprotein n=1 Tax=Austwickia sp. TVS 96-490-7B TaxID=2830843 RepID=UPI001C56BE53|nr:hypothetical protein [Austwickia sp. TVS 96-490-7B]
MIFNERQSRFASWPPSRFLLFFIVFAITLLSGCGLHHNPEKEISNRYDAYSLDDLTDRPSFQQAQVDYHRLLSDIMAAAQEASPDVKWDPEITKIGESACLLHLDPPRETGSGTYLISTKDFIGKNWEKLYLPMTKVALKNGFRLTGGRTTDPEDRALHFRGPRNEYLSISAKLAMSVMLSGSCYLYLPGTSSRNSGTTTSPHSPPNSVSS